MSKYRYGCNGKEIKMHDCNKIFPLEQRYVVREATERESYPKDDIEIVSIRLWRGKYMNPMCNCKKENSND
jgi:uncharacterized protein YkuJ